VASEYEEMTVEELREIVREREITGTSRMNHDELVATLEADDAGKLPTDDEPAETSTTSTTAPAPAVGPAAVVTEAQAPPLDTGDAGVIPGEGGRGVGGLMVTPEYAEQAKRLPEKDTVQRAYKDAMLADNPQEEVAAKVVVVQESPNADETPSGHALLEVEGIADDEERRRAYRKAKAERRWGGGEPEPV
jgi:hypothetical protein